MFKNSKVSASSMKTKLILAASLILAISIGIATFFSIRGSEIAVAEKIEESMRGYAETAAQGMAREVAATKAVAELIAADNILKSNDPNIIRARLAEFKLTQPKLETLFFAGVNGTYLASDGTTGSVAEREYFKESVSTKGTVVSGDPVISPVSGKPVFVVISPVKGGDGQVQGYVGIATPMDTIKEYVLSRKFGKDGYAYAYGKTGVVFIHPNEQLAMKYNALGSQAGPALNEMTQAALTGKTGAKEYEFGGIMKFAGYAPVPGTTWGVSVTASKAEAMVKIDDVRRESLIIVVVAVLVAAAFMYFLAVKMINPIILLAVTANKIADGDLTQTANVSSQDEVGQLAAAFNAMVANLKNLIQQVQRNAEQVATASQELTLNAQQSAEVSGQVAGTVTEMAAGAAMQAEVVADTVAVIEEMSMAIEQAAATAHSLALMAEQTTNRTTGGLQTVKKAVIQIDNVGRDTEATAQAVQALQESSHTIAEIVGLISGIAGQTNLLALNAAIEAARAGEMGRGFAVVAEEVRKLAEQSDAAAQQIAELIGKNNDSIAATVKRMQESKVNVEQGVQSVNAAGNDFNEIARMVGDLSAKVAAISVAVTEISSGSQKIVQSINDIEKVSQRTATDTENISAAAEEQSASMEEIAASSQALDKLASDLEDGVRRFRV